MANSSPAKPAIELVSAERLRELFHLGQYRERYSRGELRKKLYAEDLAPATAGQIPGTLTQIIEYLDDVGMRVALVHRYKLPDGTIGASGSEDPKQIIADGKIYILKSGS
jgi:hypothetical protein